MYVPGTFGGYRRTLDSLELELQLEAAMCILETELKLPVRAASAHK